MKKNYHIILDAEESFAKAVALGVYVKKPLTAWHFLLPGMFIFDFLRRSSETKRYSALFLFPRKLALDSAFAIVNGEDKKNILSRTEEEIRQWLTSLKLYSEILLQRHMDEIHLIMDHYSKLLNTEGNSYQTFLKNAYQSRDRYAAYLNQLTISEQEVEKAVAEMYSNSQPIWERLKAEAVQVAELREKETNRIF